ncbi:MAG: hypothetical protein ACFBSE_22100 [Prochloraceae cyanobacterium]
MNIILIQKLCLKIIIWVMFEIILTLLGLDDLADYSEFLLENKKNYVYQIYNQQFTLNGDIERIL